MACDTVKKGVQRFKRENGKHRDLNHLHILNNKIYAHTCGVDIFRPQLVHLQVFVDDGL